MITSNATNGSGGINTAGYSKNTGGGGLAGRVDDDGRRRHRRRRRRRCRRRRLARPRRRHRQRRRRWRRRRRRRQRRKGGSGKASRAIEDVRLVFERNKGSIYAIYNRALRDEPGLQGKVVLKLTIAPSGGVTDLRIVSSELKMPEVEQKLLARIRHLRLRREGRQRDGRQLPARLPAFVAIGGDCSVAQRDPSRRVVARLLARAHVPVDAGRFQARRSRRVQQQVVDAQPRVAREAVAEVVPVRVDRLARDADAGSTRSSPARAGRR